MPAADGDAFAQVLPSEAAVCWSCKINIYEIFSLVVTAENNESNRGPK